MKDYLSGIWKNRYILISLIKHDLRMKYNRSALGVAWSIITPLGLAIIIGSVYAIIFGSDPAVYIPTVFASVNPWIFLSGTADAATMSLISAEGYIKQTNVDSQIYPLRTVMVNFVNLCYSILAFFALYLFLQPDRFGPKMLMIFPGLLIVLIFAWGVANITSVLTLHTRDYPPLQSLVLQAFFYATPIVFPAQMLDEKGFSFIYEFNPFYYMLEVVRRPMIGEALPSVYTYLIAAGIAACIFLLGLILFMKNKDQIAFRL